MWYWDWFVNVCTTIGVVVVIFALIAVYTWLENLFFPTPTPSIRAGRCAECSKCGRIHQVGVSCE